MGMDGQGMIESYCNETTNHMEWAGLSDWHRAVTE